MRALPRGSRSSWGCGGSCWCCRRCRPRRDSWCREYRITLGRCPIACSCSSRSSCRSASASPTAAICCANAPEVSPSTCSSSARPTCAPPPRRRWWQRLRGRGSGRAWRGQRVESPPAPPSTHSTRATVIDPVSLSAERQAQAWLDALDAEAQIVAAFGVINRALFAHRIAGADPGVHALAPAQATAMRAGWGLGEEVGGRALEPRARAALGRATTAAAGGGLAPAGALRGAPRWPRATAHLRGARPAGARRSRCGPHAARGARARPRVRGRARGAARDPPRRPHTASRGARGATTSRGGRCRRRAPRVRRGRRGAGYQRMRSATRSRGSRPRCERAAFGAPGAPRGPRVKAMQPTRTAIGTWSGGRFMHFGEPLDDERLQALLRPGAGIDTVLTADVYGSGRGRPPARPRARRARARALLPRGRDRPRLLRGRA